MPRYLADTAKGIRGLIKAGGTAHRVSVDKSAEVPRWKRSDKEGNRESREPGAPQLPPDRTSVVLVIGSLALICVTIAILIIADIRPDKDTIREPDTAELNAKNMQQHLGGVQSQPLRLDGAPMGITPNRVSSPPTQTAVIKGLPGSPYRTPPTGNPAPRPSDTEWDAKERGVDRQLSAVAQRLGSAPESKKERLKALMTYSERYRDYLRNVRRHSKTALSHKRNRHQGSGSFFAAIGHAFGF
jgi:hypothetical protein